MLATNNKFISGNLAYRMALPKAINNYDQESDKVNLITAKPVKIHPFTGNCRFNKAYAPIKDD
jgi:hypothetical protein